MDIVDIMSFIMYARLSLAVLDMLQHFVKYAGRNLSTVTTFCCIELHKALYSGFLLVDRSSFNSVSDRGR